MGTNLAPWFAMQLRPLERIFTRRGYALALHGSMGRDLDLIAIPWTDDADSEEALIKDINDYVVKSFTRNVQYNPPTHPTEKPHGRRAYHFPLGFASNAYLDVSVMPRSTE